MAVDHDIRGHASGQSTSNQSMICKSRFKNKYEMPKQYQNYKPLLPQPMFIYKHSKYTSTAQHEIWNYAAMQKDIIYQ